MNRLSAPFRTFLVLLIMLGISASAEELWPIKNRIDLSSGFGDFRDGHFHAGLDLRTGGQTGVGVFSPVSGWVWRVSMSYYGYGKGLYIKGDDGHIYVYGHLSGFSPEIEKAVRNEQRRQQRYFVDFYLPKDSIKIDKGGFIAYSGQSGVGAPHLHFEERTGANVPINPLTHGFSLSDRVRPELVRIGFEMTDDHTLFDNARRKMLLPITATDVPGIYTIDTIVYFNRPFGVLVEGFDQMRKDGMKQAVYEYELFIDDKPFYRVTWDSLDFDNTRSVCFEYDYEAAVRDKKPVRRLFKYPGNSFPGSRSIGPGDGIYGTDGNASVGRHKARIVASDASGNKAEVSFDFIWGPDGNIFDLDSTVALPGDSTWFYLTPVANWTSLGLDSVRIMRNLRNSWGEPSNLYVFSDPDGGLRCLVDGYGVKGAVLRVVGFVGNCIIPDNIFNGTNKEQPDRLKISHEVLEDGLLVDIVAAHKTGSEMRVELYDGDRLLGVEYPQYLNMEHHACFIRPKPEYRRITRIGATASLDPKREVIVFEDSVALFAAGFDERQALAADTFFTAYIGKKNLYTPRFVEIKYNIPRDRSLLSMCSSHYQIFPEQFVTKEPFDIELWVPSKSVSQVPIGLCWLDKKDDKWIWLSDSTASDTLSAQSSGGGSFAGVFDNNPPSISNLSLSDGRTYHDSRPVIRFTADDALSGIYDDNDVYIKLDGQWLIPEYDPESHLCVTEPYEPLNEGKHHLEIIVSDRAGHKTGEFINFYYSSKKGQLRRKDQ